MEQILKTLSSIVIILVITFHMACTQVQLMGTVKETITHLGSSLIVIYLFSLFESKSKYIKLKNIVSLLLSIIIMAFIYINQVELLTRQYLNPIHEQLMGVILIILVLEACRKTFGLTMPLLTLIFILYPILGSYLPEPFHTTLMPLNYIIGFMALSLNSGLWSPILPISFNYIFLFVVFAGIVQGTGATSFFMQLGRLIASRIRGGPGLMAVVGSSAVGMITGTVGANIALTGSFTIPLMKRAGYLPHQAAAIEAAASTGGVITPPVMGAAAFMMAGLTGIPYIRICIMAALPALAYYIGTASYVYLRSAQLKLGVIDEEVDFKELILSAPVFLMPLFLIITLLCLGFSVMYTAFWAIISVLGISLIRKKTRPSLEEFISGFNQGCLNGAGIACMCAATGLIFDMFTMSGTLLKISAGIEYWSGGSLLVALLIVWAISVLMGLIGVGLVGYIITSLFAVSMLMKMGLSLEASHYFILYTTSFGFITPPVAIAAIIACKLAGSKYMPTAIEATKVGIGGFLVPWLFISTPMMLFAPESFTVDGVLRTIISMLVMIIFQIGFVGFLITNCSLFERIIAFVSGATMFLSIVKKNHYLLIIGLIFLFILIIWQWKKEKNIQDH